MSDVLLAPLPSDTRPSGEHSAPRRAWARLAERGGGAVTVLFTLAIVVLPLGYLLYGSLRSGPPGTPGAVYTGSNWSDVYLHGAFDTPLLHTVEISVLTAVVSVALGAVLAWLVARTDMPGRRWLTLTLALPLMISPLITSLAWVALAAPNAGFLNSLSHQYISSGLPQLDIYSLTGIVFVMVLHFTPYSYLAVLGALRNADSSLEEASQVMGASPLRTALRVTLPLLWPTLTASALLIFIFAADTFSVPTMLGTPVGFTTVAGDLYQLISATPSSPTEAAAAGTLLIWIALFGTLLQRRVLRRSKRYVTVAGKIGASHRVSLRGWRWAGLGVCGLYLLLAVILPYMALITGSLMHFVTSVWSTNLFTLDNYSTIFQSQYLDPLKTTLILCVITALVTTLAGVVFSYLIQRRFGRRLGAFVDYAVLMPNAAPAMVLGIGLLWLFLAVPIALYGTIFVLGIAYFVHYLGYAVRTSSAALTQLSPELEEAARVHGASSARSFRDVTLPLMRSTMLSMWTVLFVLFFLEISATILLYSPSSETIAVVMWNQLANANQPAAFALGVLQTTIIFAILAVTQRLFGTMRHVVAR